MGRGASGNRGGRPVYESDSPNSVSQRNIKEFNQSLSSGSYDTALSYYSSSGGFVLLNTEHNRKADFDSEIFAARRLADYGYRVYLDSERSTIKGEKTPDGRLNVRIMEIKSINVAGKWTGKSTIGSASVQGAEVVVLVEKTRGFSKAYFREQVEKFKQHKNRHSKVQEVFYVPKNGVIISVKV